MRFSEGKPVQRIVHNGIEAKEEYQGSRFKWSRPLGALLDRVISEEGQYQLINEKDVVDNGEILLLTPTAFNTSKLYSALPLDGSGDFTVSRDTSATYIDVNGELKTAGANIPRICFETGDPIILVEGESSNKVLDSENLLSYWTYYGADRNKLSDGSIRLSRSNSGWASWVRMNDTITGQGTLSLKAKYVDVQYLVFIQVTSSNNDLSIDLINGTVAYNRDNIPVTVDKDDDGWVYIEFTTSPELRDNFRPWLSLNAVATGFTNTNAGNIGSCLVKEMQLELGDKATSYIPTSGEEVFRAADVITVDVPEGVTQITETIDGTDNIVTTIPTTYTLPEGKINKITFT